MDWADGAAAGRRSRRRLEPGAAENHDAIDLEAAALERIVILRPGGRFAVITFESQTDRCVKRFFAAHVGRMRSLQAGGEEWTGVEPRAVAVTRRAIAAGEREVELNPRSRSAKLRIIERARE